jgi:hypothetical protein
MSQWSTQSLTEMSARYLPVGKGRPARKADNLTAICETTVYKTWEPLRLTPLWASTACYRINFTLVLLYYYNLSEIFANVLKVVAICKHVNVIKECFNLCIA